MAGASKVVVLEDTPEKQSFSPRGRRPGVSLFTSPRRQFAPNVPPRRRFIEADTDVVMLSDDDEEEEPRSQATGEMQPAASAAANQKGGRDAKVAVPMETKSKVFGIEFWELARRKRAAVQAPKPATNSQAAVLPGRQDGLGTNLGEPHKGSPQDGKLSGSKRAARQWFVKDAGGCGREGEGYHAQPDAQKPVQTEFESVPAHCDIGRAVGNGGARDKSCRVPQGHQEPINLSDDEEGRLGSPAFGTPPLAESPGARGDLQRGPEAQGSKLGGGDGGLCKARVSLDAALRKCARAEAQGSERTKHIEGQEALKRPGPTRVPSVGSIAAGRAVARGVTDGGPAAWWESGDVFGGPMSQEESPGDLECLASTQEGGREGEARGGEKRKKKAALTEEEKGERAVAKAREREEKARKKAEEIKARKRKREEEKQAKGQAKERAKGEKRVQKWREEFGKIKDAVNRNTTYIDSRLPGEALCAIKTQLEERQYPYTVCTNPIPGSIIWRLKVLYEPEQDQSQPPSQPQSQPLSQEPQGLSQNLSQGPTSSQEPARVRPSHRQMQSSQPQDCPMGPGECHVSHEHWTPRVSNPATWIPSLCESQSQHIAPCHQQPPGLADDGNGEQSQGLRLLDLPYVALFVAPDDLAREVQAGTFLASVRAMQRRVPPTSCLLLFTYGLRRLVDKRARQAGRGKGAWNSPDVGLALAQLVTHFEGVHSRECANQYDAALHVAGLHRTLAEAPVRPRLTLFDITKNGGANNKKCLFYEEVKSDPWRKALLRVPYLANRDALAISRVYPTMKSLLMAYLDPELSEKEKEQLLMNIEKPDRFDDCLEESGRARKSRVGKAMSARVYRAFTTVGDEKDESEEAPLEDTCED